jgi:spore germination cell wall hydrolase CwlJ-like protein
MAWGDPVQDLTGLTEFDPLDDGDVVARCIYSEARGESQKGKAGVVWVISNRVSKNLSEFGGNSYKKVVLKKNQFDGMTKAAARQPDVTSQAWKDCVSEALASTRSQNPIGKCLWFVGNSYYANNVVKSGGNEYWNFGSGNKKIVEKVVIGNHTFFRIEGY